MAISNEVTVFVRDVTERGVKTAAQAAVLQIAAQGGTDALHSSAFNLNWVALAGFALGGFVLSVLTSLGSQPIGDGVTASLLKPVTFPAPAAPAAPDVPGLFSASAVSDRIVQPAVASAAADIAVASAAADIAAAPVAAAEPAPVVEAPAAPVLPPVPTVAPVQGFVQPADPNVAPGQ